MAILLADSSVHFFVHVKLGMKGSIKVKGTFRKMTSACISRFYIFPAKFKFHRAAFKLCHLSGPS